MCSYANSYAESVNKNQATSKHLYYATNFVWQITKSVNIKSNAEQLAEFQYIFLESVWYSWQYDERSCSCSNSNYSRKTTFLFGTLSVTQASPHTMYCPTQVENSFVDNHHLLFLFENDYNLRRW